jgi:hypothetical protein
MWKRAPALVLFSQGIFSINLITINLTFGKDNFQFFCRRKDID